MNLHLHRKKQSPQRKQMLKHTNAYPTSYENGTDFMPKWLRKLTLPTTSKPQRVKQENACIEELIAPAVKLRNIDNIMQRGVSDAMLCKIGMNTLQNAATKAQPEKARKSVQFKNNSQLDQERFRALYEKYHLEIHGTLPKRHTRSHSKKNKPTLQEESSFSLRDLTAPTSHSLSPPTSYGLSDGTTPEDKKMLLVFAALLSAGPLMMAAAKLDKTFGTNTAPYSLLLFATIQVGAVFTSLKVDKNRVEAEKKIEPPRQQTEEKTENKCAYQTRMLQLQCMKVALILLLVGSIKLDTNTQSNTLPFTLGFIAAATMALLACRDKIMANTEEPTEEEKLLALFFSSSQSAPVFAPRVC